MNINYRKAYNVHNRNDKEHINNIDDLRKVYYQKYCIDQYIKPIDYSESLKAIRPLSPLIKEEFKERQMLKQNDKRNIMESNDSFDSQFELSKDYQKMRQREKFIEYQKELLKQIEEKKRRLANEKQLDDDNFYYKRNNNNSYGRQLRKYDKVIHSAPVVMIDNRNQQSHPNKHNEMKYKSEEWMNSYPQMMKYFEEMFRNLFKEQTDIIEEYKNEVEVLKKEIEKIRQIKQPPVKKNEAMFNSYYQSNYDNFVNDFNKEIKGILFKSKYEDKSLSSSNSLPGSSKLVKQIGDRHLIETWVNVNDYDHNYFQQIHNGKKQINNKDNFNSIMIDTQSKKMKMVNSRENEKVCNPDFHIEEKEKYLSINYDETKANGFYKNPPSKAASRYNDQFQEKDKEEKKSREITNNNNNNVSHSTYYNPNLPEIDLNQVIDFSKNDSSNIETDSENKVIINSPSIKNDHNMIPNSSKNIKVKDSFMTKLTYFDNASQIIHETIAKSSKQIVDNSKLYINTNVNQLRKQSELTQKEFFDHSLTTMNDFINKDNNNNLRNTIESYSKEVLGTSYSKDL